MLNKPGFHHLHLNSVDPDAAIDFYVRQFPSTSDDMGRFTGAEIADQCADPVQPGLRAAADLAADRDLAFRLAILLVVLGAMMATFLGSVENVLVLLAPPR